MIAPQTTRDYANGDRLVVNGRPLFAVGININWTSNTVFGNEAGDSDIDIDGFTRHIANIKRAGGNATRWWLHTDASHCPKMTDAGMVIGLGSKTIGNIAVALDAAYEHGVVVALSLFSYDLLGTNNDGAGIDHSSGFTLTGNHKFLTVPDNIDTYIENALRPMLDALGSHPAILCWEVFDKPERMLAAEKYPFTGMKITFGDILRVTNRIAGAIRRHPQNRKMIATCPANFSYLRADNANGWYSAANLVEAGGDAEGWLDFYMPQYDPDLYGYAHSPFSSPAAYWGADRPVVIGAFPRGCLLTDAPAAMKADDAYEYAYLSGYAGALCRAELAEPTGHSLERIWFALGESNRKRDDDSDGHSLERIRFALGELNRKYGGDGYLKINDFVPLECLTGDLVMKVAVSGLPALEADQPELQFIKPMDLSGAADISFDMFIQYDSGVNLWLVPVIKGDATIDWLWMSGEGFTISGYPRGEWVTVTVPLDKIALPENRRNIAQFLLQLMPVGAPYTGTIYIGNLRTGGVPVCDFSDGVPWDLLIGGASSGNFARSVVTRASVDRLAALLAANIGGAPLKKPLVTVEGKTLHIVSADNSEISVTLVNLLGKTIAKLKSLGSAEVSLSSIPPGRYTAEVNSAGTWQSLPITIE